MPDTNTPAAAAPAGLDGVGAALRALGSRLGADRVFLYARDPVAARGGLVATWRRGGAVPDLPADYLAGWADEPAEPDPMFARALAGEAATWVEDVETAPPGLIDIDLERAFGHRALAHVNLYDAGGRLVGVLQPAAFGRPLPWTPERRAAVDAARPAFTALAAALADGPAAAPEPPIQTTGEVAS